MKKNTTGNDGFVEVSVYDRDRFRNVVKRIAHKDIAYLQHGGSRNLIYGGKEKFVSAVTLIVLNDKEKLVSEQGIAEVHGLLPEGFMRVSGEYAINFEHVRNFHDGHFYLKKGELRRVVAVDEVHGKDAEGKWKEFLGK